MTGWLLDTTILSELRRPKPERKVLAFIAAHPLDHLYISAVTFAEIRFGIELVADRQTREPLVPWQGSQTLAAFFGDLLAHGLYVLGRYNVAIVAPPLTIEAEQIDEAFAILDGGLARLGSRA